MVKTKSNTMPIVTNHRLLSSKHILSMVWGVRNWDWGGVDGVDPYVSRESREANVPTFCVSYYASLDRDQWKQRTEVGRWQVDRSRSTGRDMELYIKVLTVN